MDVTTAPACPHAGAELSDCSINRSQWVRLMVQLGTVDALCLSRITAKLLEDVEGDGAELLCFAVTDLRDWLKRRVKSASRL